MNSSGGICDLCGLPLRHGTFSWNTSDRSFRFCCQGCRQVFAMLVESSGSADPAEFRESELFRQCRELGIIPKDESELAARSRPADRQVTEVEADPTGAGLALRLNVTGMWCPACAWVIQEVLKKQKGMTRVSCDFSTDRLSLQYDPVLVSPETIMGEIRRLGYSAAPQGEDTRANEGRREFVRLTVCGFLTMNVMMLSFALYSGFFSELSFDSIRKLSWPIFLMASAVLVYGGWNLFRRAASGLSSGLFGMETLVGAGALSAYLLSLYHFLSGSLHLYFDTASMLISLVLLGKYLERRAKNRVAADLDAFFSLRPTKARVCTPAEPGGRYVSAAHLAAGDLIQVESDEIVPADGRILDGEATVDESSITGEAVLVTKRSGDRIRSGTKVVEGQLRVRTEAVGDDSTLGQMIRIMERALAEKTPLEGKTDRILQVMVPVLFALATGTGLFWRMLGMPFDAAVLRAVTVLVISCPCAVGIAVPLARVAGISLAGRSGILVREFSSFEKAERIAAVIFDKTGTLTRGRWELVEIRAVGDRTENELLSLAAGLERDSEHMVAMEIKRRAAHRGLVPETVERTVSAQGGISGSHDGQEVRIGSRVFVEGPQEPVPDPWGKALVDSSRSMVYMTVGGRPQAVFVFGDRIREGSRTAIEQLGQGGFRLSIVSGDGVSTTRAVAEGLGIREAFGALMPLEKAARVKECQEEGFAAAMVGDGVNDAPALVQADLGVAIYAGGHLGQEAADITLMQSDPAQLLDFFRLAGKVNRKIHQNLAFSFLYNMISIPVAMAGMLTPLVAVSAMLCSSLSVIGNTLLLMRTPGLKNRRRGPE